MISYEYIFDNYMSMYLICIWACIWACIAYISIIRSHNLLHISKRELHFDIISVSGQSHESIIDEFLFFLMNLVDNSAFDSFTANKSPNIHFVFLSKSMHSLHSLILNCRIPPLIFFLKKIKIKFNIIEKNKLMILFYYWIYYNNMLSVS